ncbi:MAG: DUF479 domain-containing protein, partial [Chitinophagaceae bacterium]
MNHLAHLYLSGSDADLQIGNFIADAVKGKQVELFQERVRAGILLHRSIDTFTDAHPVVRESKKRLYAGYSKFAGVVTDMFYDHFLALNWHHYHPQNLENYTADFYRLLENRWAELPEKVQYFAPYMIKQNWLLRYAEIEGIGRSLFGLSQRVKHASQLQFATKDLEQHFDLFKAEFDEFFPELEKF